MIRRRGASDWQSQKLPTLWFGAALALSLGLGAAFAAPAAPLSLSLPAGSELTGRDRLPSGVQLPVGPSRDGSVPMADFTGAVQREAYFIPDAAGSLALTLPLREQLQAAGWEILVDCAASACGGFDFRFALQVLPEPLMHVNLGDFRYLAAQRDAEMIAILSSIRGSAGYVQITHASRGEEASEPPDGTGTPDTPGDREPQPEPVVIHPSLPAEPEPGALSGYRPGEMGAALDSLGHVVLSDLDFATGSSALGPGPFASLEELAAYLLQHPGRKVALVGHTDATGSLEANITVSRRRAQAVRDHLIRQYKVPSTQLTAEGIGYLAPLRSNLADDGRGANRRVEAVLLALE